jgi:hypothetical protein
MIAELAGAIFIAYLGAISYPFNTAMDINTAFAQRVDAVQSCWYRIGGEVGSYGSPHHYSLDLLCRYRVVDGVVIRR